MKPIHREGPRHKAASEVQHELRRRGVPSRYIRYTEEDIGRPISFTVERPWAKDSELGKYNVTSQRKILKGIFQDTGLRDNSQILGVGGYPTDHLGMVFGAAVCRRALEMKLEPKMLGLWNAPMRTDVKTKLGDPPDVVVLYSIGMETMAARIEACRDWLSILDDIYVVVIVGGADPVSFFNNKLHHSLDAALYFRG